MEDPTELKLNTNSEETNSQRPSKDSKRKIKETNPLLLPSINLPTGLMRRERSSLDTELTPTESSTKEILSSETSMLLLLIGETMTLLTLLRTKDSVVHAGLSQLLLPWKVPTLLPLES